MPLLTPDWSDFFIAELGALAALTGFVVVAISINLGRILAYPGLPGRAAEALIAPMGAITATGVVLVPELRRCSGAADRCDRWVMVVAPIAIQLRTWRLERTRPHSSGRAGPHEHGSWPGVRHRRRAAEGGRALPDSPVRRRRHRLPRRRRAQRVGADGRDLALGAVARYWICPRRRSAPETSALPASGSTLSSFTTPSTTSIE